MGEGTRSLSLHPNNRNKAGVTFINVVSTTTTDYLLGIIMALHLYLSPIQSTETCHDDLCLICAYENGSVTVRRYLSAGCSPSGAMGWVILWTAKLHAQTSMCQDLYIFSDSNMYRVMAMRISRKNDFAISVSADHLVCRYNLSVSLSI